jgi:methylmalonyl-CoA mutase, N-terminal domain
MVEAVKQGFPQREIADSAFRYQQEVESGERKLVGVNAYVDGDDHDLPLLKIDPAFEVQQVRRVASMRGRRDDARTREALSSLGDAARDHDENLMPYLLEAARAEATEGEIVAELQQVFGTYRESPAF